MDVAVLEDPAAAVVALDPRRSRLLAALAQEPASAAVVAARVGLPRQQVGYHLKALEDQGLVVEVGRRRHGGIVERVLAPSARSYVVSPAAMGPAAADPDRVPDRLSAAYLVALAARAVREGLSVRAVEDAVRAREGGGERARSARRPAAARAGGFAELESMLAEHLATRVTVEEQGRRGRIVVEFADLDDLERIYRAMVEGAGPPSTPG